MHPRVMLRMSLVISVVFIANLFLSGCGKEQKPSPATAKMPQVGKETIPAADTTDVFKEFYSEDSTKKKTGAKTKKVAKQETFSPAASSYQPDFSANGRYTVQITCVRSKSFANQMTGKMKDKGYPAYVAQVDNPTPNLLGTYYRVRIGGFNGLSSAKAFGQNILSPSGYEYWVDKKSNDNVGMEGNGLGSGNAGAKAAGSYDNAGAAPSSSYQSPPASSPAPSTESSSTSTYTSPSSSSSSSSGSTSSPYQPPPATASPAPEAAQNSTTTSAGTPPAPAKSTASQSAPAAVNSPSSAPASSAAPAPSATGSAGSSAKTGSSSESGWGSDSASKSGW